MKKELELNIPISNCYQFNAYPLAILGNKEACLPWIYSNFMHTCFDRKYRTSPVPFFFYIFDYTSSPWLNTQKLNSKLIKNMNLDIIEFVEKSILSNNYLVFIVNEYFIPNRKTYQQRTQYHDLMVFGFDSDKKELDVYGFDDKYMLRQTKVSYEQFIEAYCTVDSNKVNDSVILYEYNENGEYHFDLDLFWKNLKDYIGSINVSNQFKIFREPWDRAYGMEQYDYLYDYYKNAHIDDFYKDIKIIHFFYEHKYLMLKRFQYVEKNFEIIGMEQAIEKWIKIVKNAELCRNLHLKGIACNSISRFRDKIVDHLVVIEQEEKDIINTLIAENQV